MAIIVPILTQFDDKGIKSAIREFERAKTGLDKFGATGKIFTQVGESLTKNLTLPILGVGAALGVMVKDAIEAEAATSRLRQILLTTGGATERGVEALLKQASALEKVGVASRESIVTTQSQLATFDLQGETISKLTPAILDYVLAEKGASATGEDFKSMTNGLAQALNGQFASLTRVGFVLDEDTKKKIANGTESERAAAIVEVLNSTYKGFNEALAQTPEGRIILLGREFKQIKEDIGSVFLPIVLQVTDVLKNQIIPEVQKLVDKFKALSPQTIENGVKIAALLAVLGPLVFVIGKVIGAVTGFITVFKILSIALLTNPIYLVIAGLTLLVVALVRAFQTSDKFRQGIQKLGNAFIGFAEGAINFVIEHMNLFLKGMNLVIKGLQMFGVDVKEVGQIAPVALKRISLSTVEASNDMGALAAQTDTLGTSVTEKVIPPVTKMNKGLEKTSEQLKKVREAAKNAAQVVVDNLENSLRQAEKALEDVRGKFNNFKDAIGSTISGILNFGKAAESENFLKGLTDQAAQATLFADKVKQLVVLGLNERAIREVLKSGFEAGSKIADEIIAGGTTIVRQVNSLVDAVDSVADQVGVFGAQTFYQAGVTQGEALVAGIRAALENAKDDLRKLTALLTGQPSVAEVTMKDGKKNEVIRTFIPPDETGRLGLNRFSRLAKGGIVMGPTNALIGEAGPEAIVPLSGANSAKMGTTYNIVVNAGIGTSGSQVGKEIVDAIKRFEKTSGPVFASA
jgi:hypothetical protein